MITYFPKPLNKQVSAISDSLTRTQKGLGIGASGDTHAAIGSGQFVYVKDHSSLAEGLYKANAAIAQNDALSTSNLTADGSGGLNDLQSQINALSSDITEQYGVEYGSNSNGIYLKYANGTLICAKRATGTVNITSTWGSLYDGAINSLGNWAHNFISKPYVSYMPDNGSAMMIEGCRSENQPSTTSCGGLWMCRGTSSSNISYSISVIGIGRWK